jgi:ABC-type glycerol-3-phosphate transport system substrate-binding protein
LKDSKHPAEAFEVIKALAGKKSEEMLADTGLAQPALAGVAQGAHWALCGGAPHNKKMLCAAMDYVIYEPFHPRWREAKELYINPELDLVFNGQRSAPEAVKSFIGKVNRLLKR